MAGIISFLLGWPIFRCHVSFRECNLCRISEEIVLSGGEESCHFKVNMCDFFSKRVVVNSNPLLVGNKRFISKKISTNIIISISYIYPGLWFIDFTPKKKSMVINRGLDVEALRRGELWQFGVPKKRRETPPGRAEVQLWGTSQLRCSEVQPTFKPLEITYI